MRRLVLAFCVILAAAPAAAQDRARPAPIREFDLPTIEALGREIMRQDHAAWVASDALTARVKDLKGAGLLGWIVVDNGPGKRVRFLRDVGKGLEAGYDIDVGPAGETK